ncbi:uncharacterized protein MONOS_5673 [Monocercomonoides exilis]|uniref:uncharacterized protein n=1 Tax=Monocercomonoides exilis TaxID=2049356 RepID=UPI0035599BAD|nr:hypothetical protein MONOS_5673 [Monocercomonoides exilis]|eukprot:MONOS_5673.1-p1 / transcript=MONOS_5673.1 / gene=MONOS_5673 / organism=Monocercomonoides_exilis_PA203 / gene_product=uncharacterized protein / transcript_product=uncharacterized protein / location=Mono_scaffold00168:24338-25360(+) / protein_length=340 / sequence_SO=supercontig / SO=protein_coding / is_pseudo=false
MSTEKIIPVVLLCALPASGKSESRAFLRSLPVEKSRAEFKIGFPTIQLDDYPYVEMMKFFDAELEKQGQTRPFYYSELYTFKNPYVWGVLVEMLNEDYHDVINKRTIETTTPTKWMLERLDRISASRGLPKPFENYSADVIAKLCARFDDHCGRFLKEKNDYAKSYSPERTIIIEFARGGGCGAERYPDFFPLPEPFGYQYSLKQFCPEILSVCAMLYIYVTPAQSFEKNLSRAPPVGWTGSTDIFHCVPDVVMHCDYGCDDFMYLLKQSDKDNTLKVPGKDGKTYYIPAGIFDNREDLTTFCRGDVSTWPKDSVEKIYAAMTKAFQGLLQQYKVIHPEM